MINDYKPLSVGDSSPDINIKENTKEQNKVRFNLARSSKVIDVSSRIPPLPQCPLSHSNEYVQPPPLTCVKSHSFGSFLQPALQIPPNLNPPSIPNLDTERSNESPLESQTKEEKVSVLEGRKLLATSLELIQKYSKEEIVPPSSTKIAQDVEKNIRRAWRVSSLPLGLNELSECKQYHQLQLEAAHLELCNKEDEIIFLKNELNEQTNATNSHYCAIAQNLKSRIQQLEQELIPLKQEFNERTCFQKKLKALFKLDEGDPNLSIENFYYMTISKLTAFIIGVQALNSGLVARTSSWKDDLAFQIFNFLSSNTHILGAVGDLAFGGGAALPLVAIPILCGTEFVWEHYRDWKKQNEFNHAGSYFGGLEDIEHKTQYIAYRLAYLLQMQLRYCTLEGAEKIVEDWLYRLCYNLLKNENASDEEIDKIACTLMHIKKGKEKKHAIKTHAKERKWNTLDLFNKAGIAYYYKGKLHYESCYSTSIGGTLNPITRANKYGYFLFLNHEDAIAYKLKLTQNLQSKSKREGLSFYWQEDPVPLGPPVLEGDQGHITGPTVIPRIQIEEIETQDEAIPFPPSLALSSPEVQHLKAQLKHLEESNGKLNSELQIQFDRLSEVEAKMAQLMKHIPLEPQPALDKVLEE